MFFTVLLMLNVKLGNYEYHFFRLILLRIQSLRFHRPRQNFENVKMLILNMNSRPNYTSQINDLIYDQFLRRICVLNPCFTQPLRNIFIILQQFV